MIVFIDLRNSISTGKMGLFAFLDTKTDNFIKMSETQVFGSIQDLKDSFDSRDLQLSDLIKLVPATSVWMLNYNECLTNPPTIK